MPNIFTVLNTQTITYSILSSIEKKLLGTAKQIILSEIILSQDTDKSHAEELLMHGIAIPIK